ncbi:MAG: FAD-dependent oxidoreductase [Alphaproteobacteria bacterium]
MREALSALDGARFDVVIIGGGISGASTAQHLAAAGYSVLLVEKGDFASAATSRSSRLLHSGLRYLAPPRSPWEYLWHPGQLWTAIKTVKRAMETRAQFVATAPERVRTMTIDYPVYRDSGFKGWQFDLGARLLDAFNPSDLSINYRRMTPAEALARPLVRCLRDTDRLASVVSFDEYRFHWPERIAIDALLDAERMGAVVRNYTKATKVARDEGAGWRVAIEDVRREGERATVEGRILLNMTGVWMDGINRAASTATPQRKIVAVKGVHILIKLPREFEGHGLAGMNSEKEHMFCLPWGDHHYIGPTETVYQGDIEDVRPLEEDIAILLHEMDFMLPGLGLTRKDVLFAWAGARPITYDPERAKGRRLPFSVLQSLDGDGLPDAMTITWATIMFHRAVAGDVVKAVGKRAKPSKAPQPISYAARLHPENQNSPPLHEAHTEVKVSDLRFAAEREHAEHLVDILYRRTGLGWAVPIPPETAERAARSVADILGWDEARIAEEVARFRDYVARYHLSG